MAAPNYVPVPEGHSKYYQSPPRRDAAWRAERPGDIPAGLPEGAGLGRQGPDQGYALGLVKSFEDRVHLGVGERWDDAAAGCVLVGLKRASLFGRAPVVYDLEIAFRIFGFLDESPDARLVDLRRAAFDRIDNPHHYLECRRVIDSVPDDVLRTTPAEVESRYQSDWSAQIDQAALTAHGHDVSDELYD